MSARNDAEENAIAIINGCIECVTNQPSGDPEWFLCNMGDAIIRPSLDKTFDFAAASRILSRIQTLILKGADQLFNKENAQQLGNSIALGMDFNQLLSWDIVKSDSASTSEKRDYLVILDDRFDQFKREQGLAGKEAPSVIAELSAGVSEWRKAYEEAVAQNSDEPIRMMGEKIVANFYKNYLR